MSEKPTPLTGNEITSALGELPGWSEEKGCLKRVFEFRHFRSAFAFMTQVAMWAEKLDHHPNWSNVWNKVTIELCTHDAGNAITIKDVALAGKINDVAASMSAQMKDG